jgi:hypothetical protein
MDFGLMHIKISSLADSTMARPFQNSDTNETEELVFNLI